MSAEMIEWLPLEAIAKVDNSEAIPEFGTGKRSHSPINRRCSSGTDAEQSDYQQNHTLRIHFIKIQFFLEKDEEKGSDENTVEDRSQTLDFGKGNFTLAAKIAGEMKWLKSPGKILRGEKMYKE